jgi:tetratricopeptide (TPR) repeat protein
MGYGEAWRQLQIALLIAGAMFCALPGYANDSDICDRLAADPDEGIAACTRLLDASVKGVNQAAVHNNRGTGWYLKGFYDNAVADFTEAIQRNPKYAVAYHNRGRAWHKKGDYDRAILDFREALRLDPKNAIAFTDRGTSLFAKAEPDLAINDFNQAIRLNSQYGPAYLGRANASAAKKNIDSAIADLNQAISLMPTQPTPYNNRASLWIVKGEFERAIADYDKAIALDPTNWRPYSSRGEAWRFKGDLDRALADHDQAIKLDPNSADAYNNRALAWRDRGDLDSALADYDQAILLNPQYSRAYGNRGEIWRLKGDLERSISDLDRAISITPKGPVFYAFRGETFRYQGQFDRAVTDFNEALRIRPDDVAAFAGRGLTYEKMNDLGRARADFRKALELPTKYDPDRAIPAQETARSHLAAMDAAEAERVRVAAEAERARVAAEALEAERKRIAAEQELAVKQTLANSKVPGSGSIILEDPQAALPAERARQAQIGRIALVIGNSQYRNVPQLQNSGRDAEAVSATLKKVGFQVVKLDKDLTRERMYDELRSFSARAETADWALVYYAGHGMEIGGVNYLIPTDASLETDRDVQFEAIPLDQVLAAVEPARKLKLVILDACRENPFATRMRVSSASRSIARGLARIEPAGATLVVYAAKHGQVAMDGDGTNSPFVSSFLRRMTVPGVEIGKLFRLVRDDVLEATHGKQEPFTYGSLPGREDFYFVSSQ